MISGTTTQIIKGILGVYTIAQMMATQELRRSNVRVGGFHSFEGSAASDIQASRVKATKIAALLKLRTTPPHDVLRR